MLGVEIQTCAQVWLVLLGHHAFNFLALWRSNLVTAMCHTFLDFS